MRKLLLTLMLSIALISAIVSTPAQAANSAAFKPEVESVLKHMEDVGRSLNSLVATFWQQKRNTQLDIDDPVETGLIYYVPSKNGSDIKLRIDITKPAKTIVITGDKIKFYQPDIKQLLISSVKEAKSNKSAGSLAVTFGSVSAIRDNYEVSFVKEETVQGEKTSELHLIPKQAGAYKSIDIWISQNAWLPVQQTLVENNGDVTTLRLSNIKKNEQFNVKTLIDNFNPANAKIVKG